jgi:signal transduction histidine kinase
MQAEISTVNEFRAKRLKQLLMLAGAGLGLGTIHPMMAGWWLVAGVQTAALTALGISGLLLRRGRLRHATQFMLWSLTLAMAGLIWAHQGLRDPAMLVLPGILVLTGMLGTGRLLLSLLGFMAVFIAGMVVGEEQGWYQPLDIPTHPMAGLDSFLILAVIGGAAWLTSYDLVKALRRAEDEAQRAKSFNAELTTLNEISSAISAQLALNRLFEQVGASIRRLIQADVVSVALLDESTERVQFNYVDGHAVPPDHSTPYGHGLISQVLRDRKPLLLAAGPAGDRTTTTAAGATQPSGPASFLGVPILRAGQAIGVISVESTHQVGRFTDSDLKLLETLAAHVGVAIRNAKLFEAEEARQRELEQLVSERTAALQHKNAKVAALLDHVRQAIFSVDAQLRVQDECSRACDAVLGQHPAGQTLEQVLFPGDAAAAAHARACLNDAAQEPDPRRRALYLSLIPQEIQLQGKTLRPEVVPLGEGFMFAVSDHTAEKAMQAKLQVQRQGLEMVVAAVSDSAEFFATVQEFENFISQGASAWTDRSLPELFRCVHTFKGSFSQLGFSQLPAALHEAEETLRARAEALALPAAQGLFEREWLTLLERDLEVIRSTLGANFVRDRGVVALSPQDAPWVQQMARERLRALPPGEVPPAGLLRLGHLLDVSLHDELRAHERLLQRVAAQRGKRLEPLVVRGDTVWLPPQEHRPWLAALAHVFRNAIDHGIELPEEREAAGKPGHGQIVCEVKLNDQALRLVIRDDGAGVNEPALRAKLRRNDPQAADTLTLQELMLMDGISAKDSADEISGRGVGLAALAQALRALGGEIHIRSEAGRGTTVTLQLPLPPA